MRCKQKSVLRRLVKDTRGVAAVELAVVSLVFVLLVAGILDYGHAWYMKQVVTNASREGARYGVTYQTNSSGDRIAPSALSPTIKNYILNNYLNGILPVDANPDVIAGGSGYSTGNKGDPLEITVDATKTWFIISYLIPGMSNQITIEAKTVMLCE
jgi:Flp pilus assembly protein TadG